MLCSLELPTRHFRTQLCLDYSFALTDIFTFAQACCYIFQISQNLCTVTRIVQSLNCCALPFQNPSLLLEHHHWGFLWALDWCLTLYLNCCCEGKAEDLVVLDVLHVCGGWDISSHLWNLVRWGEQKPWSSIAAEIWEHCSARMLLPWNCWVCVETCTDILWCCGNLSGGGCCDILVLFCHAVCCDLTAEMLWRSFVKVLVFSSVTSWDLWEGCVASVKSVEG